MGLIFEVIPDAAGGGDVATTNPKIDKLFAESFNCFS